MRAHLAATYQTGDPAEAMVEILSTICATCGGIIDPILGKVHQGTTIRWDVWAGGYEHRNRPAEPHPAVPWPMANAEEDFSEEGLTPVTVGA